MSVTTGQSVTATFTVRNAIGALQDADSTPTGTLVKNGTDTATVVTVTNVATGRYKATFTCPTLVDGDILELYIAATVDGVSDADVVWRDSRDANVTALANLRALLPPANDPQRTWYMRRNSTLVGSLKVITKTEAEVATFYADMGRLLGANETVGDAGDISIDTNGNTTVGSIAVSGNVISFELSLGTASGANDPIAITFLDSNGDTQVATGYLLVV